MKRFFYLLLLMFLSTLTYADNIMHIKIDDAISPASAKYLNDAFKEADKLHSNLMLIEIDTPGGLSTSMRDMIQDILESKIPVVMYVSPKGARAASAGTYLLYASHVAAMAPGTNIGAATPVNMLPSPQEKEKNSAQSAMEKKVLNDAIAYIKSIAELRDRNISWGIEAVKEGKSISAVEAKEINVIDIIADDLNELLEKIDGAKVIINHKEIIINTKGVPIISFEISWKTKLLMSISNPNVAYIFLILAMYGIIFEMMNPGTIFPGVVGAFSALVALYALNILPFNYVGLLLIFLGIVLMLMELFIAGFGISGIVGVISFAFGSIMLFDEKTLGTTISLPLIIAISFVSFIFFIYLFGFLLKTRKQKSINSVDNMIGEEVKIITIKDKGYKVECNGEIWDAKSNESFLLNDKAKIVSISGLTLKIRR